MSIISLKEGKVLKLILFKPYFTSLNGIIIDIWYNNTLKTIISILLYREYD